MKLAWITDPHFNFLAPKGARVFGEAVSQVVKTDAVVITGDIAEYHSFRECLIDFSEGYQNQVYYISGNHDYYKGSFEKTNKLAEALSTDNRTWLTKSEPIKLNESTALIGHDGFYDAYYGNAMGSRVDIYDFKCIQDLKGIHRDELIFRLNDRGKTLALEAKHKLLEASGLYQNIIFATHYPPFREACWHRGGISDSNWLPWFTWKAMGDVLLDVSEIYPDRKFLVLCGHTHSSGIFEPVPNLKIWTGESEYRYPRISRIIDVEEVFSNW